MMLSVTPAAERARLIDARRGGWMPTPELTSSVAEILAAVRLRGDAALVEYTRRYDDPHYDVAKIRVPIPMTEGARSLVPPEIADALRLAKQRIERFHERQRPADVNYVEEDGTRTSMRYAPIGSAGVYVRGGRVASAAAVLRYAIPAKIAGVGRRIVLAPPHAAGVHPAVLFACSLCEIDELYALGGAQAIAAAAYGTQSVEHVEKIVGSAGGIATEAKRQLYGVCAFDGLNGPPEILVVADDGANSEYVAGELLAQAEAHPHARVAVLSESRPLLDAVAQLLDTLGEEIGSCFLFHANSRTELFETIDALAPERVALQVRDAEPYLAKMRRVGTVFVGDETPLAEGDFLAGASNVRLTDFLRSFSSVETSRERMLRDAQPLAALCEFEDLPHHAQSARMRNGS
jgi:histidinol dehydrogenase